MPTTEHRPNPGELPVLLTPDQLARDVFQIDHDEDHISHLRRQGGLPYVQFQLKGKRVYRYPREAVLAWIAARTHGVAPHAAAVVRTQQSGQRSTWRGRR